MLHGKQKTKQKNTLSFSFLVKLWIYKCQIGKIGGTCLFWVKKSKKLSFLNLYWNKIRYIIISYIIIIIIIVTF